MLALLLAGQISAEIVRGLAGGMAPPTKATLALVSDARQTEAAQPVRVVSADGAPVALELVKAAGAPIPASASRTATPMPNLYQVPEKCRNLTYQVVDSQGRPVATRLADLPGPGGLQLLVDRKIDGCRVITVKYGAVAPDQPNPPANRYRIRPLDGPSNRR